MAERGQGTDPVRASAFGSRLKLLARAGDLGGGPFDLVAQCVGPAPAAAMVGVVVVPAVDAVVVGGFSSIDGMAHRRDGTGPHGIGGNFDTTGGPAPGATAFGSTGVCSEVMCPKWPWMTLVPGER